MNFTNTKNVGHNWSWQFVRGGGEVAMQVKYQVRNQVSDQVLNQVYKQINPIRNIISQDINK